MLQQNRIIKIFLALICCNVFIVIASDHKEKPKLVRSKSVPLPLVAVSTATALRMRQEQLELNVNGITQQQILINKRMHTLFEQQKQLIATLQHEMKEIKQELKQIQKTQTEPNAAPRVFPLPTVSAKQSKQLMGWRQQGIMPTVSSQSRLSVDIPW